ncbi:uncharacterized protein [Spinacia oleracea]|uniref:TTF-type domain-containing protein n=1 Tax=Spinacia oleracea TaxID=3562 RepID=A0ABM3RKN7_SPIOL|nr:uncharacterized protein LOC130470298 [Spinacia oleracea]
MTNDKGSPSTKRKKATLDWFVQKSRKGESSSSRLPTTTPTQPPCPPTSQAEQEFTSPSNATPQSQETATESIPTTYGSTGTTCASKERLNQLDVNSLPHDPAKRKRIVEYHPMDHEVVRKECIQRGPCQPKKHKFPKTEFEEGKMRRFNPSWFKKYAWLEYSVSKDAAYCFYCYLFKNETTKVAGGDAFVINGFQVEKAM